MTDPIIIIAAATENTTPLTALPEWVQFCALVVLAIAVMLALVFAVVAPIHNTYTTAATVDEINKKLDQLLEGKDGAPQKNNC